MLAQTSLTANSYWSAIQSLSDQLDQLKSTEPGLCLREIELTVNCFNILSEPVLKKYYKLTISQYLLNLGVKLATVTTGVHRMALITAVFKLVALISPYSVFLPPLSQLHHEAHNVQVCFINSAFKIINQDFFETLKQQVAVYLVANVQFSDLLQKILKSEPIYTSKLLHLTPAVPPAFVLTLDGHLSNWHDLCLSMVLEHLESDHIPTLKKMSTQKDALAVASHA